MITQSRLRARGAFHGLVSLDAGVYGNHQLDSVAGGLLQDRNLHAVALHQPFRDVVAAFGAQHLQGLSEDDHGGASVDVVVSVNQYLLAPVDSFPDSVDGEFQVTHEEGIVKVAEPGVQKLSGGFGSAEAPVQQERCQNARDVQSPGQLPDPGEVRLGDLPYHAVFKALRLQACLTILIHPEHLFNQDATDR